MLVVPPKCAVRSVATTTAAAATATTAASVAGSAATSSARKKTYEPQHTSNIEECYKVADLVFTRAGAGSLFEIAELKKKALVVPLESLDGTPIADSHQLFNACEMEKSHPELFTVFNQEAIEGNIRKIVSKMFELMKTDEKPKAVKVKPARRATKTKTKTTTVKSAKKSTAKTKTAKTKKTSTVRSKRA